MARHNLIGARNNLIGNLMAVGAQMRHGGVGYGYPIVGAYGNGMTADPPMNGGGNGYPPGMVPAPMVPHQHFPGGCNIMPQYCAPMSPCMPPSPETLVANGVDPRVYAVQNSCPTEARRYTLGFSQTNIAFNDTVDIIRFPQVIFRGERLFIPSTIQENFVVVSITVGNRPQFAAAGETPAEIYSEVAINNELGLDTAEPGVQVILQVRNIAADQEAKDFRGAIIGAVVQ